MWVRIVVWQVRLQTARILYFTLYRQNWLQFLFVVKATALKQQTFYPHIIGTEASYQSLACHKCKSYLLCSATVTAARFQQQRKKQWIKVAQETKTYDMSRVHWDHPHGHSATWICMCCHTRDIVSLKFVKWFWCHRVKIGYEVKICPFPLLGYWFLQQLVLLYQPWCARFCVSTLLHYSGTKRTYLCW